MDTSSTRAPTACVSGSGRPTPTWLGCSSAKVGASPTVSQRRGRRRASPRTVARLSRGITAAGATRPAVLLVQVGRWAEAHREGRRLGLRLRKLKRRFARGAPWVAAARLIQRALTQGHAVAVALEEPEGAGNVKQRRLAYLFEPISSPITAGETDL